MKKCYEDFLKNKTFPLGELKRGKIEGFQRLLVVECSIWFFRINNRPAGGTSFFTVSKQFYSAIGRNFSRLKNYLKYKYYQYKIISLAPDRQSYLRLIRRLICRARQFRSLRILKMSPTFRC